MTNEQIQERAYTIAYGSMDRKEMHCDIADALREAREEALEEAAKVAEHREGVWREMHDKRKEPTFRGLAGGASYIASTIRKLKGDPK